MDTERIGHRNRRQDIQGLRALAVVAVIGAHVWGRPRGGFLGVDVFFVISGYLITSVLLRRGDQPLRSALAGFYLRRARRILPLALLVLITVVLVSRAQDSPQLAAQTRSDALYALVFIANWHFAAIGDNYFDQGSVPSPVAHFWSLGVEEQFYLGWPILLLGALVVWRSVATRQRRNPRRHSTSRRPDGRTGVAVIGSSVVVLSLWWAFRQANSDVTTAYYSTFTRAWELGAGAVLACLPTAWFGLPRVVRAALSWAGIGAIIASFLMITPATSMPAPGALVAVAGSVAVIAAGIGGPVRQPALDSRAAAGIGDISYGLYLWHYPLLVWCDVFLVPGSFRARMTITVATFVLAILSHHLLEQPIIDWPNRSRTWGNWWVTHRRGILSSALATALLLISGLAVGWARPGTFAAPTRLSGTLPNDAVPAPTQSAATPSTPAVPAIRHTQRETIERPGPQPAPGPLGAAIQTGLREGLTLPGWSGVTPNPADPASFSSDLPGSSSCGTITVEPPPACTFGNTRGPEVDVYGDSMGANLLGAAVSGLGSAYKIRGLIKIACAVNGVDANFGQDAWAIPCEDHRTAVISYLKTARPDVLIMVETYTWILKLKDGSQGARAAAEWRAADQRFVDTIRPYVKHIVIVTPSISGVSPEECYHPGGAPGQCVVGIPAFWTLARNAEAAVRGVTFLDLTHWYCVRGSCPMVSTLGAGRTLIKTDYLHISLAYETLLGPDLRYLLTVTRTIAP